MLQYSISPAAAGSSVSPLSILPFRRNTSGSPSHGFHNFSSVERGGATLTKAAVVVVFRLFHHRKHLFRTPPSSVLFTGTRL